jgi:hypothetical protein
LRLKTNSNPILNSLKLDFNDVTRSGKQNDSKILALFGSNVSQAAKLFKGNDQSEPLGTDLSKILASFPDSRTSARGLTI